MQRIYVLLVTVCCLIGAPSSATADVKIWNLTNGNILYSQGSFQNGLWVSGGWTKIAQKESASVASSTYVRIIYPGSADVISPSDANATAKFWQHPSQPRYVVQESQANSKEVYLDGKRTTTTGLERNGYRYSPFSRYNDGKVLKIGNYWKIGSKTIAFSHSTSGSKSQSFSYLNNTIMDFTYSITCSRKAKSGIAWLISKDRKSVNRGGPFLEASTFTSPAKPCYNGTVTLYYAYK